jgi:hypothetical protein
MKQILMAFVLVALVYGGGCKNNNTPSATKPSDNNAQTAVATSQTSSSSSLSPEDLGSLGAQIRKQPNDANKLLAAHGMDMRSFEAAVRKVSENPADARRYTAAYKRSS